MALSNSRGDSTMTPPATPTSPRFDALPIRNHHTASSAGNPENDPIPSQSLNTLLPGCSNGPTYPTNKTMSPPSTFLYTSPDGVWENSTPYAIMHEAPIGTGLWSSVYLATPNTASSLETPPATPVRRRGQSNSVSSTDSYTTQFSASTISSNYITRATETSSSKIWAIKAPADRAAFSVIRSEARMLTHIFSHTSPTAYMVPFLGLDPRTGGLLMHALPLTLEDFIRGDLASSQLQEPRRTRVIASLFPRLAAQLLSGLEWLHEGAGVVHADIKPSNILLRPTKPGVADAMLQQRLRASLADERPLERPSLLLPDDGDDTIHVLDFEPLYTDFSAAIPIRCHLPPPSSTSTSSSNRPMSPPLSPTATTTTTTATAPPPHLAGGTWDFLAPELCRLLTPTPPTPSTASDVYALGVALVCAVLGESPFESLAAGNAFRKREMVKMGDVVGFAKASARGARFAGLKREIGERWDWEGWLRKGLVRDAGRRVGAGEWRRGVVCCGGGLV